MNFVKFLRTPFLQNTSGRLLLAKEDRIEEEHLQRRYDEGKRLETMKIELRQTFEQKSEGNNEK